MFIYNMYNLFILYAHNYYSGLRVIPLTNISEYLSVTDSSGLRVVIHEQSVKPFPEVLGYNVQTGAATSLAVTFVSNL